MREVEYRDDSGRLFRVIVPDDAPRENYKYGMIVGPPMDLVDSLDIPEPIATRFHNALYARGMFTYLDVVKRKQDLFGAWQSTLMVDTEKILEAYYKEYNPDGRSGKK